MTFDPGARSARHTHPMAQVLVVTAGLGRVQQAGGPVQELRPGDVVWTPPGVRHWHGAAPTTAMSHLAIQECANGKNVEWMEKVGDDEYSNKTADKRRAPAQAAPPTSIKEVHMVAPALEHYTRHLLLDEV